ncbi:UbiA prenyltransferase family-domain-containing protein [Collybia nuda]|uniref:UbiA prenyltransferase family-domain-containing protein n=1 Tax=Collybia nuda TaxID=64659 RepID=A0A9P5XYU2_9AGAR|nr:UbiA prenyltransferase family-domain-containing protein [Collybia nuda]
MSVLGLKAVFTPLTHELDIFLGFSWRDWSTTIIPGSIFSIGAMRNAGLPLPSMISNYLLLISWLTPYIYFFNLSNQIIGVDEDRINKPDRPIPSGKVTLEGAKSRWIAALSTFLAIAMFERTLLPETICWVFTVAFLCLTSAGNHWFGKNCVAMTTGTWSLLSASWKAITLSTPESERYVFAVSIWAGLLTHIQDLRDVRGDAAVGRKTMPLVFGDGVSRWIITFLLMPVSFWVLWKGGIVPISPTTLTAVHVFLGYRIMQAGGPRYDHKTYMIYTYIFCLILALTAGKGLEMSVTEKLREIAVRTVNLTSASA